MHRHDGYVAHKLAAAMAAALAGAISMAPGDALASLLHAFGNEASSSERRFTRAELRAYSGVVEGRPIYLAILGEVFDVSAGAKYYAEGRGYHHFAGMDRSRAYATNEPSADALADKQLGGLSAEELEAVGRWHRFFAEHAVYTRVGRVDGSASSPAALQRALGQAKGASERALPGCNSKWLPDDGFSEVWCTQKSGGVTREWVGVPRLLPARSAGGAAGCVCVQEHEARASSELLVYEGCRADAMRCTVLNPNELHRYSRASLKV